MSANNKLVTEGRMAAADIVAKIKLEFEGLGRRWSAAELEAMSLGSLLYHALVEGEGAMPTKAA